MVKKCDLGAIFSDRTFKAKNDRDLAINGVNRNLSAFGDRLTPLGGQF